MEFRKKEKNLIRRTKVKTAVIWECQFEQLKKKYPVLSEFEIHKIRPLTRCSIRDAFVSSPCDTFCTYFDTHLENEYEIKAVDIISLYPYVMMKGYYPTETPQYLVGNEFSPENISFENNLRFHYCDEPVDGVCLVTFHPPRSSLYPFLQMNIKNKKVAALCRKCAEDQSSNQCTHTQGTFLSLQFCLKITLKLAILYLNLAVL